MQAAIYAPAGLELSPDERAFFRDSDPVGYIVFRRNIESRQQLLALTSELRGLHGRDDLPVLIDQEGGRVARMRPPQWPAFPAAAGGATIQLGAFPSGAAAEKAWKALSGRFAYLAPLSHSVVQANVNGKTYYRLRASGPDAAGICGRLKVAGEQCLKV